MRRGTVQKRREVMARKPRQLMDYGYYHLIARGNNRLAVLLFSNGFEAFKELLKESKEKYSLRLYHYCLMSNHFHLLVRMDNGFDLPRLMHFLLMGYSRWYRNRTGYVGHLWQTRYKSFLIDKESYLLECGRYIERNPVRAGIVQDSADYAWSSYRYYALGKEDSLVDKDDYYDTLGRNTEERRRRYRDFVATEDANKSLEFVA